MYPFLADLVLVVHLAFVVFVLCGGLLTLKWRWIAWLHLPAACGARSSNSPAGYARSRRWRIGCATQDGETSYRSDFIAQYLLAGALPWGSDTRHSVAVGHSRGRPQCRRLLVALAGNRGEGKTELTNRRQS